ncbi:E3 ubiquitin-protein ligase MYLIP-like [Atheta coriaria]|uniref:E3 ubiquitin-protein ligase MYLIP-like n=1 Tax=Dalotia coriaria TaxID=877792 RepID=UPI0031F41CF7
MMEQGSNKNKMYCLITQANSVVVEVAVDSKAIGQECLERVCEYLGISKESDYFGLKYTVNKGEELWLNLRNPIETQKGARTHNSQPRFALRVKFWVPPHLLLQEKTRHQFYLHAKLDLIEKRLIAPDWNVVARLIAHIAQAENGDYDPQHPPLHVYQQCMSITKMDPDDKPADLLKRAIAIHRSLAGMKASTAEYWLLHQVATLEGFGQEIFAGAMGTILGVGPHGISVYAKDADKQVIPFTAIQNAKAIKRNFKLTYVGQDNIEHSLDMKFASIHCASSLYRAITEKHAFYSCETVRSAVTAQFVRDLKGTIVSIFNEDSSLGKNYVFDIRRTCREVYDDARRALYSESIGMTIPMADSDMDENRTCNGSNCKESQKYARLLDAMTCCICMDAAIDALFQPCRHAIACLTCAEQCERCPFCRANISEAQRIYFQGEVSAAAAQRAAAQP